MNANIFCTVAWMSLGAVYAQDPNLPPLPSGPLLKRAPAYSHWLMTSQGSLAARGGPDVGSDGQTKPVTTQSEVVKTGQTILEQNVDLQGGKQQIWHISGVRVMKSPEPQAPLLVCPDFGGGDIYTANFAVSDFAGLDWVSASNYIGIKKYEGRDCIVFSSKVSPLDPRVRMIEATAINQAKALDQPVPEQIKVPAIAYIDLDSRVPLFVGFGSEKRVYQYYPAPESELDLPAEIAEPVRQYAEKLKRLNAPAMKAF